MAMNIEDLDFNEDDPIIQNPNNDEFLLQMRLLRLRLIQMRC